MQPAQLLGIGEVAALLGLVPMTVRYYDDELQPMRVSTRRIRVYERDRVLAFQYARARRTAARAAR